MSNRDVFQNRTNPEAHQNLLVDERQRNKVKQDLSTQKFNNEFAKEVGANQSKDLKPQKAKKTATYNAFK